ncbi:MAG: hypothetical protein MOB07_17715 [Acidobacteria bacterium]|nr:hypothetical protein [Acidobacteriota bacterium]
MNCQDFEKLALALARNSLLDATAREQGLIHTEDCERCAARLAEERALLACVRAIVADLAGEEPPERVEKALLAAFRAQTAAPASSTVIPMPSRARNWSSWKLAAVAAGILLLITVMAIFWRSASSLKQRQEKQAVAPTPVSTPAPQATPLKPTEPPVGRDQLAEEKSENRRKSVRRQSSRDGSDEAEVVTRFFSLREGEDLTALESLQLVRVELRGSALGEVGLPVDPETANAPVLADVVLGQDGLARAIRFVR